MREHPVGRWLRALGLSAVAMLLSVASWWEMLAAHPRTQNGDGQFFVQMIESMRVSVVDYHEFPLWNPYQCGGVPLWDHPQGISSSPLVWAFLPFGTTRTIECFYIVHSALGFVCMWFLARHELKLSVAASLVASAVFAFAGAHNQHLTGGHLVWVSYLYYPLALFLWRRAEHSVRHAIGLGLLVAWAMHEGGAYPLPHLALLLGLETLTRLWPPRRLLPIARAGAVVAVVGLSVGASRFLPVADQLHWHSRSLADEHDAMTWQTLKAVFLDPDHARAVPGQEYAWTEYGDYVGPIVLGLAAMGILLGAVETWWMLFLLIITFMIMLGHQGAWAPASILKHYIYPFTQMRVPSRLVTCVTVFVAAYAGIAVDRLRALALRWVPEPRLARGVAGVVLVLGLIGAANIIRVGVKFGEPFVTSSPQDPHVQPSPRLYLGGPNLAAFIDQPTQHRGRLDCWEEWAFEQGAALWQGDVPQAKPANTNAKVTSVVRTPNTFQADVDAKEPTRILLNSSYDRGWRTTVGTVVDNDRLLAVDVPAGVHHVQVRYWPQWLTLGIWITLAGILGVAVFLVRDRRRHGAAR